MASTERPIIIDLGSRRRSDIRDLKRGEGELAYEVDRVLQRVLQEFGQQGQQGQQGGGAGAGAGISAGVSTSSGASAGISAQAGAGQRIQPVIVVYRERSSSRTGGFMSMFDDDDDDDRDRDRDRD